MLMPEKKCVIPVHCIHFEKKYVFFKLNFLKYLNIVFEKRFIHVHSKAEGKDQVSIQSSTAPDPGHRIGK